MNPMKARAFRIGFILGLVALVAANLVAAHFHSDGGLFEAFGLTHRVSDGIRLIGFPFQILEEGGFAYRHMFSPLGLLLDVLVAIACASGMGLASARIWPRFVHEQV
jgi:hypothetical protein